MREPRSDTLAEAALTAYRERDSAGRILASPWWRDLAPAEREELFDLQVRSRVLEQALDPRGRSSTVRAVLARIGLDEEAPWR